MSGALAASAFASLRAALAERHPEASGELRPPEPFDAAIFDRPGAEQLRALWSETAGQPAGTLGALGGLRLLGPVDSEAEREKWRGLFTSGAGLDAVARPGWDASTSRDPDAVRAVYFAAGWIPVLSEPLEANYLAVDLVPLAGGRAGQIILCGRDEDEKRVVAPDLAAVLQALAAECREGLWQIRSGESDRGPFRYLERQGGRLLTACRRGLFPRPK